MRVLHVDTEHTWRGGEQQLLYLATGLKELGIGTEIVCQPCSPLAGRARNAGLDIAEIRMRGELNPLAVLAIRRRIRHGNFDIGVCT